MISKSFSSFCEEVVHSSELRGEQKVLPFLHIHDARVYRVYQHGSFEDAMFNGKGGYIVQKIKHKIKTCESLCTRYRKIDK